MTRFKKALVVFEAKKFHKKVELGNGSTYGIRGVGSTSLQLDSGKLINIGEILYVPSLKKNVISVKNLEDKEFPVTFSKGKVLIWPKGKSISSAIVIGVREGDLYKVPGHAAKTLYPSQDSEIKREKFVLSSPQPSGVAEDERVIFHQSSSDSKIESYKTSRLEKQREKA